MTEQEHISDVVRELKKRLLTKCDWDVAEPYETEAVQNVIMIEKIEKFFKRLPEVPNGLP